MRFTFPASALLCAALLFTATGDPSPRRSRGVAASTLQEELRHLAREGARLFAAGRYREAALLLEPACRRARLAGDRRLRLVLLNNLAGCYLASFQYSKALQAYLQARRLAEQVRDWEAAAAIWCNLASLYMQLGEAEATGTAVGQAWRLVEGSESPDPRLLLRVATVRARQGDLEAALPVFERAMRVAETSGDWQTFAHALRTLGYEYLQTGQLERAERVLLEEFRWRLLNRAPDLYLSYRNLALLRMAQGDFNSAEHLMQAALAAAEAARALVPLWSLYYDRGRLRLQQQRLEDALADFRMAVDLARRWRAEALRGESFQVSVDVSVQQLYGALAETAATLAVKTGRQDLAREAFEATEENRAAGLRLMLEQDDPYHRELPAGYAEAVAELHALEASLWKQDNPQARARLKQVRQQIVEMEFEAGLATSGENSFRWDKGGQLLRRVQRALATDEAFLAFYLGRACSYRWAVTARTFRMDRLPTWNEFSATAARFVKGVRAGAQEAAVWGRKLYELMFGGLGPEITSKPVWLLALDQQLFEIPMPALVAGGTSDKPRYLVAEHAVQLVPSAYWLDPTKRLEWRGRFVGVADPIYNRADQRWRQASASSPAGKSWQLLPWLKAAEPAPELELPRVPGSAREIRACAAQWADAGPVTLLEGPQATLQGLRQALSPEPAVLHLATHVLAKGPADMQGLVALGFDPSGKLALAGPAAIRTLRPAPRLVVLSGCNSGTGPALPGAGLLGLGRAWLAAGSRAVIASLWPTPDDTGELFQAFYRHLTQLTTRGLRAPAIALQNAQQDMLASGNWRAQPSYWAAYFLMAAQ